MDTPTRSAGGGHDPVGARELRQAVLVLEREGLSGTQRRLFSSFVLAVWVTWGLFALWFLVLLSRFYERQQTVLFAAAAAFVVAVALFLANLAVAKRLWSAFRTERRLGIARYVSRLIARVSATQRWFRRVRRIIDISLFGVGTGLTLVAGGALVGELRSSIAAGAISEADLAQVFGVLCLLLFGLACIAMPPMQWARRRLDAVERLRAGLQDRSHTADDLVLIETLQRTQILMRRAGNTVRRRSAGNTAASMRLSPQFRDAMTALDREERRRVYAALGTALNVGIPAGATASAGEPIQQLEVAETPLAIAISHHPDDNELIALDVFRHGRPVGRSDAAGAGDPAEAES